MALILLFLAKYENSRAEKTVEAAEKRLLRAREALEKAVEQKKA
jgi:hypothetical protein